MSRPVSLALVLFGALGSLAYADNGSLSNTGGVAAVDGNVSITSDVASPAGSLTIACKETGTGTCGGGSFEYVSHDNTRVIKASFTSGTYAESCSGGGRYHPVVCGYNFTGLIRGTFTLDGSTQEIEGSTYQSFIIGKAPSGTTAFNSAYTPFYYSDSEQILRSDDLQGTNLVAFGKQGSGVNQFYGAFGIAVDSTGRIYVADTYNCRIVRFDNMSGKNWVSYGSCGSGHGHFSDPSGIGVSSKGEIYVLDTGNSRIVRIEDMKGSAWASYGKAGSGVGEFAGPLTSIALDTAGKLYVADTGNKRVVRIDGINGAHWTTLTKSPAVNGVNLHSLSSPSAVAVASSGKIFVGDRAGTQSVVVRVDNMAGANWTTVSAGPNAINSLAVDSTGTVFAGGGGVRIVDDMDAVLNSSNKIAVAGSNYIFAVTPAHIASPPPPAITLSTAALAFPNQKKGTHSAAKSVRLTNFGGHPLALSSAKIKGEFGFKMNCPSDLYPGSSCTFSVSFEPTTVGAVSGTLTLADNSGNLGSDQVITLKGVGTN